MRLSEVKTGKTFLFSAKLTYRSMNSRVDTFKIAVLDTTVFFLFFVFFVFHEDSSLIPPSELLQMTRE